MSRCPVVQELLNRTYSRLDIFNIRTVVEPSNLRFFVRPVFNPRFLVVVVVVGGHLLPRWHWRFRHGGRGPTTANIINSSHTWQKIKHVKKLENERKKRPYV